MLANLVSRLRAAGCVYAEDEAALLRSAASSPDHLESLVARRVAGEPLEVVVGWADFCGVRVVIEPGAFVPRQRTGLLVDLAVALAPSLLVDLCCGSGAVGAAVAARLPDAEVHSADVDPVCVACARRNLPSDRVHHGDLYDALPRSLAGRVDVLVANAPYVPTDAIATMPPEARDHEPRVALDGGADGVDVHRRIVAGARSWLRPGGTLLIETGRRQAALTAEAAEAAGLGVHIETDDERDATAVVVSTDSTTSSP